MDRRLRVVLALLLAASLPVPTAAQSGGKLWTAFEGEHTPFNGFAADDDRFKGVDLVRCGEQDEVSFDLMAGLIDAAQAEITADGGDRCIHDRCFAFEVMPAWAPKR
jgi:hypothetical protein